MHWARVVTGSVVLTARKAVLLNRTIACLYSQRQRRCRAWLGW